MNLWVIMWIVLSIALFVFFIWSNKTLYEQKKTWKAFAEDFKMTFQDLGWLKSPIVSRKVQGLDFKLFSEEQIVNDLTRKRFVSVLEWQVPSGMPGTGFIASADQTYLADFIVVKDNYNNVADPKWDDKNFFRSNDPAAMDAYLTSDRLKIIIDLLRIKDTSFVFVFDENTGLIRLESNDPLTDLKQLKTLFRAMYDRVPALMPDSFHANFSKAEKKSEESEKPEKPKESE